MAEKISRLVCAGWLDARPKIEDILTEGGGGRGPVRGFLDSIIDPRLRPGEKGRPPMINQRCETIGGAIQSSPPVSFHLLPYGAKCHDSTIITATAGQVS